MKKYLLIGLLSAGFGLMAPIEQQMPQFTLNGEMMADENVKIAINSAEYNNGVSYFEYGKTVYLLLKDRKHYRRLTDHETKNPNLPILFKGCTL
ncbi:hypothetical protein [Alphaproteobacteria bacterium endosymbiont of Tiliacea citrago]|uniref:hypothetical protein n=1 Tax=Alphaproteobacteria bacterium endosymbiont of Tiliacea citrago TaxID=3077944 RepID=UPI00313E6ADE